MEELVEKLPPPDEEDEKMEERCTCHLFNWQNQTCPFFHEVEEREVDCNCCPYHYRNCLNNI